MSNKELEVFLSELKSRIGHNIYKYTWLSGCSTEVHPVEIFHNRDIYDITIQLTSKRNYFSGTIKSLKKKYKDIIAMYYCKHDGSCPNTLSVIIKK
jgi:hypothetical protein